MSKEINQFTGMSKEQHEMSDEELDQVFSNAAENLSFDFDPAAWTKMQQKLDAAAKPASSPTNPWRKRSLLALLVLLLLTTAYYFAQNSSKQTTQNHQINAKKSVEKNDKIVLEKAKIAKDKSINNNKSNTEVLTLRQKESLAPEKSVIVEKSEEKIVDFKKKTAIPTQKQRKLANKVLSSEQKFVNDNDFISGNSQENVPKSNKNSAKILRDNADVFGTPRGFDYAQPPVLRNSYTEKSTTNEQDFSNKKTTQSGLVTGQISTPFEPNKVENLNIPAAQLELPTRIIPQDIIENENRLALKNLAFLAFKQIIFKPNFIFPAVTFEKPAITSFVLPKSISNSFKKGLYLRLAASPDISLTRMNEMTKSGSNWAALVEYRFNQRWSVQSGVIRSMKYYNTSPESYQWPTNWSMPPSMIDINATCKMLDIPVNIRYDITKGYNKRIFVSAGATSYVMLNEKYVYNYVNPNNPSIKWKGWEGKTGSYYFSTLNFSLGYERQVLKKLSLQIEPFLKTPISKIGFGKVNLSTVGVFVSAKYPLWN